MGTHISSSTLQQNPAGVFTPAVTQSSLALAEASCAKLPTVSLYERYQNLGGTLFVRFVNEIETAHHNGLMKREYNKPTMYQANHYVAAWPELSAEQINLTKQIYGMLRYMEQPPRLNEGIAGPDIPELPLYDQALMAEAVKLAQAFEM